MKIKKYVAEFFGTAVLVLLGCGSAVAANTLIGKTGLEPSLAFTTLLIAFAFGLSIVAMAYSIGHISGCHVNPAVSLAMFATKRMDGKDFVGYVISQILGALGGALLLSFFFGSSDNLGANGFLDASALGTTAGVAFVVEMVLTFVFVFTVLNVTKNDDHKAVTGIVIGLTLTLVHILGVPFTGTSVNPARSLGPAVISGGLALDQVWLFLLAPIAGSLLAALIYMYLNEEEEKKTKRTTRTTKKAK